MSLHKFAEQVAAHGRGDDSLLIHMTPDEVNRLQKFAEANGRTLTINPHTGLPEAGFLSDLFKAVAPIALGAFLGPAGFGMSAAMAGVATGGITALATGSLSRGLMAGLGAYGGAGLGGALAGAGESALGANLGTSLTDTQAQSLGFQNASTAAQTNALATAPVDKLTAGFNAATASPTAAMDFAKANYKPLLAAAAPIMAGAMVPTTTSMPTPKSDNYIRQFDYNINPETGKPDPLYGIRAMTPVKANEWGNKTFQGQRDAFRQQNPNPYELGVGSLNQAPQPVKPMASGGIVALAEGGYKPTDTDIFNYFKTPNLTDTQIAQDMQKFGVSAADIARATGTQGQQADYEKRFVNTLVAPTTDASEFLAATKAVGLQDQSLANAMQNAGLSQGAQYALTHAQSDKDYTGGIIDATTGKPVSLYTDLGYTAGALPGDQGGLEGLYGNINYVASGLQNQINSGKMTVAQAQNAALAELARTGVSVADVNAATGKSFGDLFTPKKEEKKTVVPPPFTTVVPGGTQLPGATVYDNGAFGNYGSGPATGVDYLGRTVSIATPGDIITNPDGTRTVVPNIPGRPYGGFTGIEQLKSRYTAGGGSLGYTPQAPKTIAEFNQLYNKQTGDSLAAYDYLMGKGSGKYPAKSTASQISAPYAEYVLGKKTTGLKPTAKTTGTVVGTPGQPQTYFNEAEYLAANPDVAAELKTGKSVSGQPTKFTSGYEHWLMYGQAAGRPFTGDYQGYKTALALTNASQQGGESPSGPSGNTGNTISGFTPAPPDMSIPEASMGIGPAADGNTGSTTGTEGGSVASAKGGLLPRRYANGGVSGSGNLDLHIPLDFGSGGGGYSAAGSGSFGIGSTGVTGATGGFSGRNNTAGGSFGGSSEGLPPYVSGRPSSINSTTAQDIMGRNVIPSGLDDSGMGDANIEAQQRNAALRAQAGANPASMADLAKRLGFGMANGGMAGYALGGGLGSLGSYSDGGRLLKGPGDGVSDSIPATIGAKQQPARLADGEFVIPARIVSELGNGSTDAGAKKLYAMMDRVQRARGKTTGKNKVAANSRADKYLPA